MAKHGDETNNYTINNTWTRAGNGHSRPHEISVCTTLRDVEKKNRHELYGPPLL